MEKYGYNYENDGKFYIDTVVTPHYAFTVFASNFVIDFIEKNMEHTSRNYLMDATFDSLPKEYYQLFIISIEYQNDVSKMDLNHEIFNVLFNCYYSSYVYYFTFDTINIFNCRSFN